MNTWKKKEHYESVSPKIQLSLYEDTEKKKKKKMWGVLPWCIKWMQRPLPLYPALVIGDIFSIEQLIWWRVFAQAVLWGGARIHEGLRYYRQTGVRDAALMDVKDKLRVLDHIYPETQRKAGRQK